MKRKILAMMMASTLLASVFAQGCEKTENPGVGLETEAVVEVTEASEKTADSSLFDTMEMFQLSQEDANFLDDKYRSFYEVFLYSFYDSNGDGIGDIPGLIQKLDYLNDNDAKTDSDLGVNGLWLMPIMPSPTYHKYDVTDYYGIDESYGTMEDFEELVDACHERGINLIIDLVLNHTSSEHPWFQTACEYLENLGDKEPSIEECPEYGYYNFSKEMSSGAWYPVGDSGWYYEGEFWEGMPDLNLDSEAVREEIAKITAFWQEKGVDGFRLDAVTSYYTGQQDKNIEFLSWLNDTVKGQNPDAYMVGEAWTGINNYAAYYASGIDSFFDFDFANNTGIIQKAVNGSGKNGALSYGKAVSQIDDLFAKYSDSYIDAPFYTNHDMARSAGYYSGDGKEEKTKIAGALNLLMRGNAFLYYGEELGMKGSGIDENKRAPMQWLQDADGEGMCDGPENMDVIDMTYGSLEEQEADPLSIYQYYKSVLRVRNAFPAIARGTVSLDEEKSNENMILLRKNYEGEEVVLVMNLSEEAQELELTGEKIAGKDLDASNYKAVLTVSEENPNVEGENLVVPAYGIVVYEETE